MGETISENATLLSCGGAFSENVYGCYVYGIFDNAEISSAIIEALYKQYSV